MDLSGKSRSGLVPMHRRAWGRGEPVIALHPLGLESSAFSGFGRVLAKREKRTVAVDLPGFGRTPAPDAPLTPATLAEPVIALAHAMKTRPALLGISLGGRVALEAAMTAPDAFRSVTAIAPYMPWTRYRFLLESGRLVGPGLAAWMPFERVWPLLQWIAKRLENSAFAQHDELAQAAARFVYFISCPATRASFFAAARELALDPPFGENGFWTRLPDIPIPTAFVWGEKDGLVSSSQSHEVEEVWPAATQVLLPCASHWLNGPHHRCVAEAAAHLIDGPLRTPAAFAAAGRKSRRSRASGIETVRCLLERSRPEMAAPRQASAG